jgi:inosine-uridine nucleoside N-ribohydrolase
MTRQMMTTLSQTPALALPSGQSNGQPANATSRSAPRSFGQTAMPSLASLVASKRPTDTQEIYEHISDQIRREPAQSTRLLESWINAPVEEDE